MQRFTVGPVFGPVIMPTWLHFLFRRFAAQLHKFFSTVTGTDQTISAPHALGSHSSHIACKDKYYCKQYESFIYKVIIDIILSRDGSYYSADTEQYRMQPATTRPRTFSCCEYWQSVNGRSLPQNGHPVSWYLLPGGTEGGHSSQLSIGCHYTNFNAWQLPNLSDYILRAHNACSCFWAPYICGKS